MTRSLARRFVTLFTALCATALACAPVGSAGTYRIDYGAGLGPGWTASTISGIRVQGNTVATVGQSLPAGSTGGLTFDTGSAQVSIVAGTIDANHALGTNLRARVYAGSGLIYSGSGTNLVSLTLPSTSFRTLQVGLYAQTAFAGPVSNELALTAASLLLSDPSRPVVSVERVPVPTTWYGPSGCIMVSFKTADEGSGVMNYRLRSVASNATIDSWSMAAAAGPRPGVAERNYTGCVPADARPNGVSTFEFSAQNGAGETTVSSFSLRTDRTAPVVSGGPAERVDVEAPYTLAPFTVRDPDGSGVTRVDARIDGTPAATSTTETGVATVATGPLGVGIHVIEITATDAVGNATTVERRINVVDTTAPVLERITPGDGGSVSLALLLRAHDAVSGIRASSWAVALNGGAVSGSGDGEHFRSVVESLAPGVHRFEAGVSDLAGNRTTITFTYVATAPNDMPADIVDQVTQHVTSQTAQTITPTGSATGDPTAPGAAAAASASSGVVGAWIVRGASANATFGMPVEATVFVARAGRAVPGRRVAVLRAGTELGSATTGPDGLARVGYTAGMPGDHSLVVEGLEPLALQVAVAPRVLLASARTARRGAKVRITGRVQPALTGHPLVLEARSGSGWFVVRRGLRTGRGGTFATTFTANARGTFQLRVRLAAHAGWQAATSTSPRPLTVR